MKKEIKMKNKINNIKSKTTLLLASIAFAQVSYAQDGAGTGAFDSFVDAIEDTTGGIGEIMSYVAYALAGILFFIAGWNMYKKSKNPNGNEGGIILGALIAGSVLLAIPTVAGIGTDGIFGDAADNGELIFGGDAETGGD